MILVKVEDAVRSSRWHSVAGDRNSVVCHWADVAELGCRVADTQVDLRSREAVGKESCWSLLSSVLKLVTGLSKRLVARWHHRMVGHIVSGSDIGGGS
jgi:hypothetical protein